MDQAVLVGLHNENEIIYLKGSEFSLGRGLQNSYVSNDPTVSRCHCLFKFENNKWTILDKSSNGTLLNSKPVSKHLCQSIENNDIIELNDNVKYKFNYRYNISKKRRVENNNSPESSCNSKEAKISNDFPRLEVHKLKSELCREKAIIKKLTDDSKEMQNKIFGLEVDLFNKISSSVKLEQEIMALKHKCADLQKEKDDLEVKLDTCVSETNILRQSLEISQALKAQAEKPDEEDKSLLQCVLKTEIIDKETIITTKIYNTLTLLQKLDNKDITVKTIRNNLLETQKEMTELMKKRNELAATKLSSGNKSESTKEELFNIMETDLQCSICNEIFIKTTSLSCGHAFCKMCIGQWRKQKNTCPVCRVHIKNLLPCIAVDNYIDQTIELLSPGKKELRTKLKETHEASTSSTALKVSENHGNRSQTVYISSDSDSDTEDWDTEDFSDHSDGYFGGFGACYVCGAPDHWANTCPRRRRYRR